MLFMILQQVLWALAALLPTNSSNSTIVAGEVQERYTPKPGKQKNMAEHG